MIQFFIVFFIFLIALSRWDDVENLVMSIGEHLETVRDDIADGHTPISKFITIAGITSTLALFITLIL